MHFFCVVLVDITENTPLDPDDPNDFGHLETAVSELLEPYSAHLEFESERVYLTSCQISEMTDEYETSDLSALAEQMCDWNGYEGGTDEKGLFYIDRSCPDREMVWDWYTIGGRWDGVIRGSPTSGDGNPIVTSKRGIANNYASVEEYSYLLKTSFPELAEKCLLGDFYDPIPFGILVDGEWILRENYPNEEEDKANEEWRVKLLRILENHVSCCVAVGCDLHS